MMFEQTPDEREAWLDELLAMARPGAQTECLAIEELIDFRDGATKAKRVAEHLATCGLCAEQFLLLDAVSSEEPDGSREGLISAALRERVLEAIRTLLEEMKQTLLAEPGLGYAVVRGSRDISAMEGHGDNLAAGADGVHADLQQRFRRCLRAGEFAHAAAALERLRLAAAEGNEQLCRYEALCRAVAGEHQQAQELLAIDASDRGTVTHGWPDLLAAELHLLRGAEEAARELLAGVKGKHRRAARILLDELG
jgi:hypothetical protein